MVWSIEWARREVLLAASRRTNDKGKLLTSGHLEASGCTEREGSAHNGGATQL